MSVQSQAGFRSWHDRLRFTLRGLLISILFLGCWLGIVVRSARIQHEAVRAIDAMAVRLCTHRGD